MENKTIDDYFHDWHLFAFGFGYGTGEVHTISALKAFLALCNTGTYKTNYDYEVLERELSRQVAWLLINRLCHHELKILEYGTSPRYAWLTPWGAALRDYILSKTLDELCEIVAMPRDGYIECYPDCCNCGENGYSKNRLCNNPFWKPEQKC